ncbi:MAG: hypothetical protein PUD76_08280 [Clostridia bacterium]|nr:hypothetical protein [Clostridia bacterium]
MDNFEIYDNVFQTLSLMGMMVVSGAAGLKYSSRKLVVLACAYGSIMLGTLFYMLHLTIIGDIPRIFYVSEISWMAGYLFFLFLVILRQERKNVDFQPVPAMLALFTLAASVHSEVMGNSILMSLAFGVIASAIVYISSIRIRRAHLSGAHPAAFDRMMIAVVILQILVYFVSEYVSDFSTFNLYFAVDILFTLSLCSLFRMIRKEAQQP